VNQDDIRFRNLDHQLLYFPSVPEKVSISVRIGRLTHHYFLYHLVDLLQVIVCDPLKILNLVPSDPHESVQGDGGV